MGTAKELMRRGQSTLEYIVLIGAVAAGIIVMLAYISRGFQGNLRSKADQLGAGQYDPGNMTIASSETKTVISKSKIKSETIVEHGNMDEPNKALKDQEDAIEKQKKKIQDLKEEWENIAAGSAVDETSSAGKIGEGEKRAREYRSNIDSNIPERNLATVGRELSEAQAQLITEVNKANELAEAWSKRKITSDKTTSSSVPEIESGGVTSKKKTEEVLGDL